MLKRDISEFNLSNNEIINSTSKINLKNELSTNLPNLNVSIDYPMLNRHEVQPSSNTIKQLRRNPSTMKKNHVIMS